MNCLIAQLFRVPAASTAKTLILKSLIPITLLILGSISGSKCLAAATASPSSVSWAAVSLGTVGASKSVRLTNGGSASIAISSVAITGTHSADFLISSKTCASRLGAHASCTVTIRFKPLSTGTRTATLSFIDSASNSPLRVVLSGIGTASISTVAATPINLTFGSIYSGSSGKLLSATLSNGTSASVALSSIAIAGVNAADFAISSTTCGSSLAAFSRCTATILFKTAATGTRSAALSFIDSAKNNPQTVALLGTGIAPAGNLSLSPSSINWASVSVGMTGAPKSTTLTNKGSQAISIGSIAMTSTDPKDFKISSNTCGTHLGANASCTLTLVFTPTAIGTRVALLTITDSAINSPQTVAASGNGGLATAVPASITVDFGSRSGTQMAIANSMVGAHYLGGDPYWGILSDATNQSAVVQAGLKSTRMHANIPNVYATMTPDWTKIDPTIQSLQALGVHPILEFDLTPPWLRSSTALCPNNPAASVPSDLVKWGQMAASYVAHFDQAFPGVVLDYEIWNEPNGPNLCSNNKLNDYLAIYAAAAPLMKAQATADGVSIRVGGPASAGVAMTSLLTDPRTAPFVDFFSYHTYLAGPTEIQRGMTWDGAGGTPSLLSMTLNSTSGLQAQYLQVLAAVHSAKTPLGAMTPIYLDEYNDDWSFNPDCCRNSPTYSPLFNSLAVAQILNSAYSGANQLPRRMVYYAAASNPSSFCLLGIADAAMNCARSDSSATATPYPQWYTYQLISAPGYLDLMDGGFMAKSITLSSGAKAQGLVVTAFYTATTNSILLINPTASSFGAVTVQVSNAGLLRPQLTLYTLNSANLKIGSWPASMVPAAGGSQATFDIPPHSVLGMSLTAH